MADRFALIIEGLCHALGRRTGRGGLPGGSLSGPLLILIWSRLRRMAARFTRLATRGPAPSRTRAPRPSSVPKRARAPLYPSRRFAALLLLVPETAPITGQLRHLLADPEMTALLATTPQLGRILRPLCRMLGIRPAPTPPPDAAPSANLVPSGAPKQAAPVAVPPAAIPPWATPPPRPPGAAPLVPA